MEFAVTRRKSQAFIVVAQGRCWVHVVNEVLWLALGYAENSDASHIATARFGGGEAMAVQKKGTSSTSRGKNAPTTGAYRKSGGKIDPSVVKKIKVGLILGFLVLSVLVVFDTLPLLAARGTIADRAEQAAAAAASNAKNQPITTATAQQAYNAAIARINDRTLDIDIDEESFRVNGDGTVTMRVEQEVNSFLLAKYPLFAEWYQLEAEVTTGPQLLN